MEPTPSPVEGIDDVECMYCGAKPGEWCHVKGGTRKLWYNHERRWDRYYGYRSGERSAYARGLADAKVAIDSIGKKEESSDNTQQQGQVRE